MATTRRYKRPTDSVHRTRAMRMINGVRNVIVESALEEEQLDIATSRHGHAAFVRKHQKLQDDLAGHFPYIDIRGDQYASDVAHELAKDIVFYILHGDTPGGS